MKKVIFEPRYPFDENPAYHQFLNQRQNNSLAKNTYDGGRRNLDMDSIQGLKRIQGEYFGFKKSAKHEENRLLEERKNRRQKSINTGRHFDSTPTIKELENQALNDFLTIELDWLEHKIAGLMKAEKDKDDKARLRLINSIQLGHVESISYNTGRGHFSYYKVEPLNGNGIVIINDPLCPYNGMSILDLRDYIVPAYRLEVDRIYQERLKSWEAEKDSNPKAIKPLVFKVG